MSSDSRRGLEMWGPVGRWAFLNWPRGSWQYDLICGAIIAGLFVLPNPSHPETQNADLATVLSSIETASEEVDSFTADLLTIERIELFDDEETESGTVAFMRPLWVRKEVTDPAVRTEVIAEDEVTIYIPRIKQAQIMPLSDTASEDLDLDVPGMTSGGSGSIVDSFDATLLGVGTDDDGATTYEIRLTPKPDNGFGRYYQSLTMTVAEGEWYPARRIVLENHTGDTTTMVLSNVDRDAGLEEGDVRIDLPSDTEIIRRGTDDRP